MPTRYSLALIVLCGFVATGRPAPPAAAAISAEDEKLLKEHKLSTAPAVVLDYFRKRSLEPKALDAAGELLKKLGDDDYFVREKATEDLRKRGAAVVPMLRRALSDPDEEIKDRAQALLLALEARTNPALSQAAVRALRARAPAETVAVLFDYLPTADSEATEEEVFNTLAILGVKDGKVDKLLDDALKDKQPTRRAAAGLVLARSGSAEQRKAAQALLADPDPTVRFRTAQGLLAGRDRSAVPVLCALVGEGPMGIGTRAEELLQCLAGTQPPRTPAFSDDAPLRKRARQIWEEWWKQNAKMDLAKAEIDLATFNLNLKSRDLIRQFGAALMINDVDAIKKCVDDKFIAYGNQVMAKKEDVDRYLESNNLPGRGQQASLVIAGMVSIDKYLTGPNIQPQEKAFLEKRKDSLRAYNVYIQYNPQFNPGPGEEFTLFIKASKDQVKIIGFGQPRGRAMEKW
jgi:HEAT repeat protein